MFRCGGGLVAVFVNHRNAILRVSLRIWLPVTFRDGPWAIECRPVGASPSTSSTWLVGSGRQIGPLDPMKASCQYHHSLSAAGGPPRGLRPQPVNSQFAFFNFQFAIT